MNICLFGGAFDPPHLGHQQIAASLLELGIADEVWYVPVKIHDFAKQMSPEQDRLNMLELIVGNEPKIKIETHELETPGVSYTHQTLDFLSSKHPDHTFSWVIGSDNLKDFHKWDDGRGNNYQDLLAAYTFYVYPRKNYPMEPLYENMIPLMKAKEVATSSTEIRAKIMARESIAGLVDPQVETYIQQHNLYQG